MAHTTIPDHAKYDGRVVEVMTGRADNVVLIGTYRPDRNGQQNGVGVLLDEDGVVALIQALIGE